MKAISIRQPWAWLILHAGKNIENRDWPTRIRGRVLVHAGKTMYHTDYLDAKCFLDMSFPSIVLPAKESLERGGLVGSVEIADCVTTSDSPWFFGNFGFVLRNPKPMPFRPLAGQLGFFEVEDGYEGRMLLGHEER